MLRYAVVGSGAVGCFYGIRLANAGAPVQFLFRHDGAAVRSHGLLLTSPDGDRHLRDVQVATTWSELDPCDVLLVAVKATSNADVLDQLAAHADRLVGPGGGILLVQNGIGAEQAFARAAPGHEVLGGLASLCSQRTGPASVAHLDFGTLTIAAYAAADRPAGLTPLMHRVAADLGAAGVPAVLDEDLVRARWRKLMWNIPFNPLSVILSATTDELVADGAAVDLIATIMAEVAAAAAAEGRELPAGLPGELIDATARMAPYATSMKLDADAGRPLEIEAMLGEPLRRAAVTGTPMPAVRVLHRQLGFLDARRARS